MVVFYVPAIALKEFIDLQDLQCTYTLHCLGATVLTCTESDNSVNADFMKRHCNHLMKLFVSVSMETFCNKMLSKNMQIE